MATAAAREGVDKFGFGEAEEEEGNDAPMAKPEIKFNRRGGSLDPSITLTVALCYTQPSTTMFIRYHHTHPLHPSAH
jgi:hypothetical protein